MASQFKINISVNVFNYVVITYFASRLELLGAKFLKISVATNYRGKTGQVCFRVTGARFYRGFELLRVHLYNHDLALPSVSIKVIEG